VSDGEVLVAIVSAVVVVPPGVVGCYSIAWLWKRYRAWRRNSADLAHWELEMLLLEDDDERH
jgi:hypothetical protein